MRIHWAVEHTEAGGAAVICIVTTIPISGVPRRLEYLYMRVGGIEAASVATWLVSMRSTSREVDEDHDGDTAEDE